MQCLKSIDLATLVLGTCARETNAQFEFCSKACHVGVRVSRMT